MWNIKYRKVKQYVKYKVDDSNDIVDAQTINRVGKASGKNKNSCIKKKLNKQHFLSSVNVIK